ncbi:MAG: hypothetical protein HXX10_08415 [Rhodoplanes sp.]|uniref:hypothetical protein n=1 Tax=Rhodoplanes sp. TaxID=1968906 RepID=UPI001810EF2A|nr:hypothetical protein [Rhodoplanes sp.]NVO14045.1 hypothetical protein [Rhodoplanes sp.]
MPSHIVRVAAQNLASSILDTNDLSTSRGGSLALLRAVEALDARLSALHPSYRRISGGASELLGLLDVVDGQEPAVEEQVRQALAGPVDPAAAPDLVGRDFTFAVTVLPIKGGFAAAAAQAEARIRVDQYRTLSFVLPPGEPGMGRPCEIDRTRPAVEMDAGDKVSRFVVARRHYGRKARQGFYATELARDPAGDAARAGLAVRNLEFSNSLSDLTAHKVGDIELPPALSGKIAIVHLDGNAFQKRRNTLMSIPKKGEEEKGAAAVAAFSAFVRTRQTRLLAHLLDWALDARRTHMVRPPTPDDQQARLRFETLLWGGDEMVFAVPVWAAWDLVLEIEDELRAWTLPDDGPFGGLKAEERRLTHAIGLAFVNHKAPIRQSRRLADDLCSDAKDADKTRTVVSAFAAETVELPRGDLDTVRKQLLLNGAPGDAPLAFAQPGSERPFRIATEWFTRLKGSLDRSQAMKLALAARQRAGGLPAADAGAGENPWPDWAVAEIRRVVRGAKHADVAIAVLGLGETRAGLPFAVPRDGTVHKVLPLMMALHLWDYVQPLGPNCHDGAAP